MRAPRKDWTAEENQILIENCHLGEAKLLELLPKRCKGAICSHKYQLRLATFKRLKNPTANRCATCDRTITRVATICRSCHAIARQKRTVVTCADCGTPKELLTAQVPAKYVCQQCRVRYKDAKLQRKLAFGPTRKTGTRINRGMDKGYRLITIRGSEFENDALYQSRTERTEHILIAERAIGRRLKKGEVVHHINGVKTDNRNSNFIICSNSYHKWLHNEMSRRYQKEHFNDLTISLTGLLASALASASQRPPRAGPPLRFA